MATTATTEVRSGFRRVALSIQYHGSSFLGVQKLGPGHENCITDEHNVDLRGYRSVYSHLEEACTSLFGKFDNLQFSSRTDRGVHALKNVLHVDVPAYRLESSSLDIRRALNAHLRQQVRRRIPSNRPRDTILFPRNNQYVRLNPNNDVQVIQAKLAPTHCMPTPTVPPQRIPWHARFHAVQRTYLYRIVVSRPKDYSVGMCMDWDRTWRLRSPFDFDVGAMQEAASVLMGRHDFSSFRGSQCQAASPVVELRNISVWDEPYRSPFGSSAMGGLFEHADPHCRMIHVVVSGDRFLYRMVRNIVGLLVQVGARELTVEQCRDILHAKDRSVAPQAAPAAGLFLVDVLYDHFEL